MSNIAVVQVDLNRLQYVPITKFCVDGYKLSQSNRKFLYTVNINCAKETLSQTI
jgi:hypothetical protein